MTIYCRKHDDAQCWSSPLTARENHLGALKTPDVRPHPTPIKADALGWRESKGKGVCQASSLSGDSKIQLRVRITDGCAILFVT